LVISYIPASQDNTPAKRILYILPLEGTAPPQPLFAPPSPDDRHIQAEWSPDGKYIYYVQYDATDKPDPWLNPPYHIYRMAYPNGQLEKIADLAFWPRVSPDSTKLVYISIDPESGRNDLYIVDADGSNPQLVALSGSVIPEIIDAPIFSPDGQAILFSAPFPGQSYQPNWFEKLVGIQVARAHDVPSDWWSVPVTGGVPTKLTNIQTINLFASISPDNKHVASVSGEGLFVMNVDGSNLTQLVSDPGIHGTVNWIP
jgi:Tol biopolymer transport system component